MCADLKKYFSSQKFVIKSTDHHIPVEVYFFFMHMKQTFFYYTTSIKSYLSV